MMMEYVIKFLRVKRLAREPFISALTYIDIVTVPPITNRAIVGAKIAWQ
jgi:hypothetical protein